MGGGKEGGRLATQQIDHLHSKGQLLQQNLLDRVNTLQARTDDGERGVCHWSREQGMYGTEFVKNLLEPQFVGLMVNYKQHLVVLTIVLQLGQWLLRFQNRVEMKIISVVLRITAFLRFLCQSLLLISAS